MILNRDGASFEYAGVTYTFGGPVIGTDASEYHGLYGVITEIRDGDDREDDRQHGMGAAVFLEAVVFHY